MIDIWVAEPFFHSVSYLFRHTFIYFPEMRNKSMSRIVEAVGYVCNTLC